MVPIKCRSMYPAYIELQVLKYRDAHSLRLAGPSSSGLASSPLGLQGP